MSMVKMIATFALALHTAVSWAGFGGMAHFTQDDQSSSGSSFVLILGIAATGAVAGAAAGAIVNYSKDNKLALDGCAILGAMVAVFGGFPIYLMTR